MIDIIKLGWDIQTLGEVDHQKVKPPYVRLISCTSGHHGDVVYAYDLRVSQPNKDFLTTKVLHSFEHLLLAGFKKYFGEQFINVAPMGCQTGFYLVLLNEGEAEKICGVYEKILSDILQTDSVPYAALDSCGQFAHHDLENAKVLAKKILHHKDSWRTIL